MRLGHRTLLAVVALLAVGAVTGMALLRPGDVEVRGDPTGGQVPTSRLVEAVLVDVETLGPDDIGLLPDATIVEVTARLEDSGEVVRFEMVDETGEMFAAGQRVKIQEISSVDGQKTYVISDFSRAWPLAVLAALFVLAVLAFGRLQGARALLGLVLTFVVIIAFIVPAILDGRSPVSVALIGAVAIMIVTLYLSHGYSRKTTAAVVGTALALLLTGLLAALFVSAAHLTGFSSEEARLANLELGGLSLRGLLLAGIIIGGLGVLDDVTMSQSSMVFELQRANPAAGFADLVRGAINVGRDHIAATVNTLFLAYAGAALPLLILFVTGPDALGAVLTAEIVAVEIVRTLVGSLGLIAAVPLTTFLAAALALDTPAAPAGSTAAPAPAAPAATPAARRGRSGVAAGGPTATRATTATDDDAGSGRSPARDDAGDDDAGSWTSLARDDEDDDDVWVQRLRDAYHLPPGDEGRRQS